ncbi:MAG: hydrogenase expression/formation protein HypE [Smithellaceae bacterium]|nr:hydrogenase expression/formation protein HypE [Smithellaceae bacterium]
MKSSSFPWEYIQLGHGSGGRMGHELVEQIFLPAFRNETLLRLDDAAVLPGGAGRLAFTTDSYVVTPLFFPGGDIGKLAICGTVNDLSMSGACCRYLSAGFIIEEGFPVADLVKIVSSMAEAAREAGVMVVAGDTKVVNRGSADQIFINTAGIGFIPEGIAISAVNARPGNLVILSGSIGDHGMAVLSEREGIRFHTTLKSDCAPLNGLVAAMLSVSNRINCLRDPTRGGLAATLNELAVQSGVAIKIEEGLIPVKEEVRGACELLGFDPLHLANEGKLVAIVDPAVADDVLKAMRTQPLGREAAIIGAVQSHPPGRVMMKLPTGATRIVDMPLAEPLPRIC